MKRLILSLLATFVCMSSATADDFFMQEDEALEEQNQEEENSFTILNAFGAANSEAEEQKKQQQQPWAEFEDISGTDIEQKFLKSDEVRIRRELRKPLPDQQPFGDKMDSLEESVRNLRTPNVIDTLSK